MTGKECWIYPLRFFIEKLEQYHKSKEILPLFRGLDAIKASLENSERRHLMKTLSTDSFLVRCDNCGNSIEVVSDDIGWEWECLGGDERSMGTENQYIAEHDIDCPNCGNEVHITFNVWEYPVGAYNYSDIEIDGGTLETDFDFRIRLNQFLKKMRPFVINAVDMVLLVKKDCAVSVWTSKNAY